MNKDLISVIVPVYNVKDYLERCVESIVNQTYKNIEILLINDGSSDESGKLCDYLENKYDIVKVYHKENGGLSDARNYGISKASGKYLSFVDSDDYININMIECLYSTLIENNADISFCDLRITNNSSENIYEKQNGNIHIFNRTEAFYGLYTPFATRLICCCIKLYKKEIFNDILFPLGKINEDLAITHYIINKIDKIVGIDNKYYYYFQRDNSIMHSFDNRYLDSLNYLEDRKNIFKELNDQVLIDYTDYYIALKACILYNDSVKLKQYKEITKKLKYIIKNKSKVVLKSKNNTWFQKIICLLFLINPRLYRIMEYINLKRINRR